ncbi:MAG: hypothetical protein QM734_05685 [Cyclobacteriaceae bacterium]
MMKLNHEQWFDDNKAMMPKEAIDGFEQLRMYLRGWPLFEDINVQLGNELVDHAWTKFDDLDKVPLLRGTLISCANYYILMLCGEVEGLIMHSEANTEVDLIEDLVIKRNKLFDKEFNRKSWKGSKDLLQETIDIFQKSFFTSRRQLLDIEGKWWQFYKHTFQLHGMKWYLDAYHIILELRKEKNLMS